MAWPKDSAAAFSGASGQAAVVAELLQRKCNAAIPFVDIGTDVFAFKDDREEVARIQVKTDTGKPYRDGNGYSAKFGVPSKQLGRNDELMLYYALAVRINNEWANFVVISRFSLHLLAESGCGSVNEKSGNLELHIQFRKEFDGEREMFTAKCGKFDLTAFVNAWESLPPLAPI